MSTCYFIPENDWTLPSFTPTSYWSNVDSSQSREVPGNYVQRYTFSLEDPTKYSHLTIRLYYRCGVSVMVNGNLAYVDRINLYAFSLQD